MSTRSSTPPGEQSDGMTQQVAAQAQEKAQQLAGQAQEQAQQAAGQAKNRLRQQLDQRSSQAAEQINSQASDLRAVSDSLREQGKEGPATAADRLAQYAEKVGGYLRDRDSDALLADAEDFGRSRPWAVAAGGMVLGLAAARFLKASSSRRYATRSGSWREGSTGDGVSSYPSRSAYPPAAVTSGAVAPSGRDPGLGMPVRPGQGTGL